MREAALTHLSAAPGVVVDYVALVDPDTFIDLAGAGLGLPAPGEAVPCTGGSARTGLLALAARVGTTRLIDNALVRLR